MQIYSRQQFAIQINKDKLYNREVIVFTLIIIYDIISRQFLSRVEL